MVGYWSVLQGPTLETGKQGESWLRETIGTCFWNIANWPYGVLRVTHFDIFVLQSFYIEPNSWNCLHGFVTFILQSIKDGSFSCIIQTKNKNTDFLGTEEALENFAEHNPHGAQYQKLQVN